MPDIFEDPKINAKSYSLGVVLILAAASPCAADMRAHVVGVSDGDTITVLDQTRKQYKVRLAGIDAPEKKQAFGNRSKQSLAALVFDRPVEIDVGKTDRYGRTVGKVRVGEVDVCLEQVRAGMAWHYKKYQSSQPADDRLAYAQAETEARAAKRGLWQDRDPLAPWEFRSARKGR